MSARRWRKPEELAARRKAAAQDALLQAVAEKLDRIDAALTAADPGLNIASAKFDNRKKG